MIREGLFRMDILAIGTDLLTKLKNKSLFNFLLETDGKRRWIGPSEVFMVRAFKKDQLSGNDVHFSRTCVIVPCQLRKFCVANDYHQPSIKICTCTT